MKLDTQDKPQDAGLGSVARGSGANLVGIAVLAGCTMLMTIAVSRSLSKEAAGVFFSTTAIFVLATVIGQLGSNTGLVYFLSRARGAGTTELAREFVRCARGPVLFVAISMAVALYIFAPELSQVINGDNQRQSTDYLRVLAFFIPLAGLENIMLAATRGLGTMRANVIVEQFGRPVLQLILVLMALAISGTGALPWAWAVGYLPAAIAATIWWQRNSARWVRAAPEMTKSDRRSLNREFWRFSGPRALASVGQSAMQRLDIVLVGALAGATAAALYTAATRFLVIGQMGTRAISMAVQPKLGAALGRADYTSAKFLYHIATAWLMILTWPMFFIFLVFSERLLTIFGPGYESGTDVLRVLAVAMLIGTGCGMVDMVLNMAGKTSWNMYNVFLSMGVQLGLDIILIPQFGILGAAIGWAVAIILSNIIPLTQLALALRLHPFGRASLLAAAVSGLCWLAVPAISRIFLGDSWGALLGISALSLACYAPLVWLVRGPLHLSVLRAIRGKKKAPAPS